jgi:hypothetical protein
MVADWRPAPFVSRFPRRDKRRALTARAKETNMMDLGTCSAKDCDKPRFRDYYVCAEHFVFYAAPQYTESMVVKVEKVESAPYPDFCLYPETTPGVGTLQESPPPDPSHSDATTLATL